VRRVDLVIQRRRNVQVAEWEVIVVHKYKGGRPPERVPGRGLLGGHGLHEVVDIAKRAKFNDAESDKLIPLNGVVDI
jgi:hypothetical protein